MSRPGDDDFLARWSQRKRAAESAPAEVEVPQEAAPEAEARAALEAKSDEEILEELGLPDPDSMEQGADFKAFLTKAVPERIRNRALRRLWLTNPVLANLDELLDYGEDFTDAASVVENLQTAYRVGQGFITDEELAARDAAAEQAEDGAPDTQEGDRAELDEPEEAPDDVVEEEEFAEATRAEDIDLELSEIAPGSLSDEPPPAVRRRMRFHIAET